MASTKGKYKQNLWFKLITLRIMIGSLQIYFYNNVLL